MLLRRFRILGYNAESQSYSPFKRRIKASNFSSDVLLFKILGLEMNFLCSIAIGKNILGKMGIRKRVKCNWGRAQRQQVEEVSRVKESSPVRIG